MAPITLLTAPPVFSTQEQHAAFQASTPASGDFTHDPVLHFLAKSAKITLDPVVEGFELDANDVGDVYVTEGSLSFFNPSTSKGFSVPYPTLSLHAISRQPISSASHPSAANSAMSEGQGAASNGHQETELERSCIYCQLDENEGADYDDLPEEELIETRELCIFPTDPTAVRSIYDALSTCAALHPSTDPSDSFGGLGAFDDADEEGEPVADADGQDDLTPAGRTQLARLESLVDWSSPSEASRQAASAEAANEPDTVSDDHVAGDTGSKRKR